MTYLYAIRSSGANTVKIGIADDPQKRLCTLSTANPHKLWLYAVANVGSRTATAAAERQMHEDLDRFRLHGEWFDWNVIVRKEIHRAFKAHDAGGFKTADERRDEVLRKREAAVAEREAALAERQRSLIEDRKNDPALELLLEVVPFVQWADRKWGPLTQADVRGATPESLLEGITFMHDMTQKKVQRVMDAVRHYNAVAPGPLRIPK